MRNRLSSGPVHEAPNTSTASEDGEGGLRAAGSRQRVAGSWQRKRWRLEAGGWRLHGLLALLTTVAPSARAQTFNPSDYVVLKDFGDVRAVAATNAGLFVVTPGAIAAYDTRSRRWLPPVTALDGLPDGEITMAIGDPADESLWIAMTSGLVQYLPVLREVRVLSTQGTPVRMMFDSEDPFRGIYVATRAGWFFAGRGMGAVVPATTIPPPERQIRPLAVSEALERVPGAEATRSLALLDEELRNYRFTAAASDPYRGVLYFGTNGAGVFEYDPDVAEFEPLFFGLLSNRVGAVTWHDGVVWAGTGGGNGRRGFTRVETNLQEFRWYQGSGLGRYGFLAVRDLRVWEGGVWAATDNGVIRIDEYDRVRSGDLPSPSTYALAESPAGLWVGTSRGVAMLRRFAQAGVVVEEIHNAPYPVLALAAEGHDMWIGTSRGLRLLPGTEAAIIEPPSIAGLPIASEPIADIEFRDDRLFVATPDRVMWRAPDSTWTEAPPLSASIGTISSIAIHPDESSIWIAGSRGIAWYDYETNALRTVVTENVLPGRVVDMEVGGGFVWVATDGGLIRMRARHGG